MDHPHCLAATPNAPTNFVQATWARESINAVLAVRLSPSRVDILCRCQGYCQNRPWRRGLWNGRGESCDYLRFKDHVAKREMVDYIVAESGKDKLTQEGMRLVFVYLRRRQIHKLPNFS